MELDNNVAYIKAMPIRTPSQLPRPIITNPISEEWDNTIKDMYWYHTSPKEIFKQKDLYDLRELLLSFGGSEVCLPVKDDDTANILSRGQLWYGDRIIKKTGYPSQCHSNSADYWYRRRNTTVLCTGYALSKDGMWRMHSWCIDTRNPEVKVIETTTERVAYFGFAMTKEEALKFYDYN